jgi:hypothetical protein
MANLNSRPEENQRSSPVVLILAGALLASVIVASVTIANSRRHKPSRPSSDVEPPDLPVNAEVQAQLPSRSSSVSSRPLQPLIDSRLPPSAQHGAAAAEREHVENELRRPAPVGTWDSEGRAALIAMSSNLKAKVPDVLLGDVQCLPGGCELPVTMSSPRILADVDMAFADAVHDYGGKKFRSGPEVSADGLTHVLIALFATTAP